MQLNLCCSGSLLLVGLRCSRHIAISRAGGIVCNPFFRDRAGPTSARHVTRSILRRPDETAVMSNASDQPRPQTPVELAAALAEELNEAMPAALLRPLEPETLFSAEITWHRAKNENGG